MIVAIVIIYILGSIFTYGFVKGVAMKRFSNIPFDNGDNWMACAISIIWPVGLPIFTAIWSDCSTKYWCIRFRK